MIIKVKTTPTNEELITFLRKELPSDYSVKEFGLGKKTVMIKKSAFIGAQITVRENDILVEECPPSFGGTLLSSLFMIDLGSSLRYIFGAVPTKYHKFENEVAGLINNVYN